MPLFEVAVLEKFKKGNNQDADKPERLLLGPKALLAKDQQAALFAAVFELSATKDQDVDRDRLEVIVRLFA